jgi:hypothetical protein
MLFAFGVLHGLTLRMHNSTKWCVNDRNRYLVVEDLKLYGISSLTSRQYRRKATWVFRCSLLYDWAPIVVWLINASRIALCRFHCLMSIRDVMKFPKSYFGIKSPKVRDLFTNTRTAGHARKLSPENKIMILRCAQTIFTDKATHKSFSRKFW